MTRISFCTHAFGRLFAAALLLATVFANTGCECGITESPVDDDDSFVIPDDDDATTFDNEDCSNGLDDDGDGATDCADSDCTEDPACAHGCVAIQELSCGDSVTANNGGPGHTEAIDSYGCTTWDESGPEYTFSFNPTVTEEVTAALTVSGHGNLDVFILDGSADECDGTNCIAYGASNVHWTANAGEEYFVVVDGYAGGADNFQIELLCPSGGGDGEICDNGLDDDGDGATDCDDADCALDPVCIPEDCGNLFDDDGDLYVDCDDDECIGDPACDPEDCTNGIDDNGNTWIDCEDPLCFSDPNCSPEECRDGIDNDGDGFVDCDDVDCDGDTDCIPEGPCDDGLDGDGDGLIDCDDDECFGTAGCIGEDCTNSIDDDGDGLVDCADPECAINPNCIIEICANGVDDDGDGDVDCDDSECAADAACAQTCTPLDSIACEQTLGGDTAASPFDQLSTYSCTPLSETGNEDGYSFVAATSGEITVTLENLSADLDLFVVQDTGNGCDGADCLDSSTAGGTTPESITLTVTSGDTYYVVVDGFNNTNGTYDVTLACAATGVPEDCANSLDDDGDGLVDCDDPDCAGAVGCQSENCTDGIDNDGDGSVDCADTDCTGDPGCVAENCGNGVDDDGDGDVDCDDTECALVPGCGSENCINGVDDDSDGAVDCDDGDCLGDPVCNPGTTLENCTNGTDDDGDGAADCADTDCTGDPGCGGAPVEICGNGVDDDFDSLVDCDDPSCFSDPACGGTPTENCTDGVDNDGDGDIDCADSNCTADVACGGAGGENCTNTIDDNGDGDIDCDDILCLFSLFCWFENCSDGADNDFDGLVDCADSECNSDPNCIPEACNNGIDDDGDGDIDCSDSECATAPACVAEVCDNGIDDDADGAVDCADVECSVDPNCVTEICSNGVDDDFDGDLDCDDAECAGNPVCASAAEICDNDVDDNGNGLIDCAEASCATASVCIPENCSNGMDDDGDLDADCDDSECASSVDCGDELCWNGADDDGDGLVDCDDDQCAGWPSCNSEVCDDGVDNDSDGLVDCDDDGCVNFGACNPEACDNDIDDDLDGLVDCGDPDCTGEPECISTSEVCDDGTDNDGDGDVDCDDADCVGMPACAEDCTNNVDDDGDGDVDCDDSDCTGAPGCDTTETSCDDGFDNDGDGNVDCADTDCTSEPECNPEGDCTDGVDGDGDGDVDCDDDECAGVDPACGEVCDNGVDDDGNGDIDCDDAYCQGLDMCSSPPGVGGVCQDAWQLSCGDGDSWMNYSIAGTDNIDQYNCSPWDESGPEYTYVFRPEASEEVEVCLSNMNDDLDIFIVADVAGGCDGANCVEYGHNCATFDAVAGETYYLVVDGYQGAQSTYDIDVTCPSTAEVCDNGTDDDADGLVDCDDSDCAGNLACTSICTESRVLSCGFTDFYGTDGSLATDDVDSYACSTWQETGPEVGYYFQAPTDQANEVTISLSYDWQYDFDVFVMEDNGIPCDSSSCIEFGLLSANFNTIAGADYWVAVDTYTTSQPGPYSITVSCNPIGGENCTNGIDDDGDGDVDCDDSECENSPSCGSECVSIANISCGQVVYGNTATDAGATNQIGGYPCNVGNYSGPEVAYEWTSSVTGTVEFGLVNPDPTSVNHDLFALDGDNGTCINNQCLDSGFNSMQFEAVAGHTYYLVIDGFDGDAGEYTAHLDCNP